MDSSSSDTYLLEGQQQQEEDTLKQPSRLFTFYRFVVLIYWSAWVIMAIIGTSGNVHIPPPLYEYLDYGVMWLIYATNW